MTSHAITAGHGRHGFDPRAALWLMYGGQGRGGRGRHGHRGGRHGFGPGWGGPPFGRGPRARRGDVRAALLVLLAEEPRNGYGLMQEIEQRSEGEWRPSPGSVYPALSQLEDEGLVRAEQEGSGRRFALTDAGRAHGGEHRAQLGEPWANPAGDGGSNRDLRRALGEVGAAAMMVARAGGKAQS